MGTVAAITLTSTACKEVAIPASTSVANINGTVNIHLGDDRREKIIKKE